MVCATHEDIVESDIQLFDDNAVTLDSIHTIRNVSWLPRSPRHDNRYAIYRVYWVLIRGRQSPNFWMCGAIPQ